MSEIAKLAQLLDQGLMELGISRFDDALLDYLFLLAKWNNSYNLTAIRDLTAMVTRHLLDSLAILPYVRGSRVIDVGTGAGLPGIPLAILLPQYHFVLLDSNGKKIRFLQEVKRKLKLSQVEIIQSRVENYQPELKFDTVISRAFSDLAQMVCWTNHLLADQGVWLAMKGRYPQTELTMINHPYQVHHYQVPGMSDERCAVIIKHDNKE